MFRRNLITIATLGTSSSPSTNSNTTTYTIASTNANPISNKPNTNKDRIQRIRGAATPEDTGSALWHDVND